MARRSLGKGNDEYVTAYLRAHTPCESVFVAAAALEMGALFGALSSGIFADKYSRQHSIFFASGEHVDSRFSPCSKNPISYILLWFRFANRRS